MRRIKSIFTFTLFAVFISCGQTIEKIDSIEKIESAHKKDTFLSKDAISFDLQLFFGGNERLNATITVLTNSTKAIIELKDSTKIIVDESEVYYSPTYKKVKSVRFDAFTWTYFMLFPYKLSDTGTKWSELSTNKLNGATYDFQTLTFKENIGDAPDDWYKVYSNQKSNLIHTAAYIVTAGKTLKEAENDPHAIKYSNYQIVEGIPLASEWSFWEWQKDKGLTKQLGSASLNNFKFLSMSDISFEVPSDYLKSTK